MTGVIGSDGGWRALLAPDEKLLWTGAPEGGLKWRPSDWLMVPFSLMWGGFAIFWESMVWAMGGPWFMKLWGVPFVLIGLYLMIGRFFADAWMRGRTRYALTDRRALIATDAFGRRLESIPITPDTDVAFRPGPSGAIMFPPEIQAGSRRARVRQRGFEFISDGERVYRLLLEIQSRSRESPHAPPSSSERPPDRP